MRVNRPTFVYALLALLLSACNLAVPQVTPTVAPTRTPSPTREATEVAQVSATATLTPSYTHTASVTPTPTLTHTPTPTRTRPASATPEPTETPTATLTPSRTPTPTRTPSVTPLPITVPPTRTPTPTPTITPSPTVTPTSTRQPTETPTVTPSPTLPPTLSLTDIARLNATRDALEQLTRPPTWTPAPTNLPTRTLAPTLDVTPTFITAEATLSDDLGIITTTPLPATTTPRPATPPPVPPTPEIQPTVEIRVTLAPIIPIAQIPNYQLNFNTRAFAIVAGRAGFQSVAFNLPVGVLFAQNPVNPNQYMTVDGNGLLYFVSDYAGGQVGRIDVSPFSVFIPQTRAENNAAVNQVTWSPNGSYVAFLVDGDTLANDGIWFFSPGGSAPLQLLVDCPPTPGCQIVNNPFDPDQWESVAFEWAPSSDALLTRVMIHSEGRAGLVILPVTFEERARDNRPPVFRFDYGSWSPDGSRVLASGRGPDGRNVLAWIDRGGGVQEFFDASARGLWLQNAVQTPDGEIVALGSPNGPGSAMSLYDANGNALTQPIGDGPPQRVDWSPDKTHALVVVNGRVFIVRVSTRTVTEVTGQAAGASAIGFATSGLPPEAPPPFIPSGVIEGSDYQPGQQLRVVSAEPLNLRDGPSTGSRVIGAVSPGMYLAILAGPVQTGGIRWWQVQLADGTIGWMAGEINGFDTLSP